MVPDAAPARIERVDSQLQIPSAPSVDVTQILLSVHSILRHIDRATAGPELSHAMKELEMCIRDR